MIDERTRCAVIYNVNVPAPYNVEALNMWGWTEQDPDEVARRAALAHPDGATVYIGIWREGDQLTIASIEER